MYSANVICRLCGGGKSILIFNLNPTNIPAGHMARDCRGRGDPNMAQNKQTQFDSEYSALMAELGEGAAPGAGAVPAGAVAAAPQQDRLPPWRIPENWMPGECLCHRKRSSTDQQETDSSQDSRVAPLKVKATSSKGTSNLPHTATAATTSNNRVNLVDMANNLQPVVIHMLRKSNERFRVQG